MEETRKAFVGDTRELFVDYGGLINVRQGGTLVLVEPADLPVSNELREDLNWHRSQFPPPEDPWPKLSVDQRLQGWLLARRLAEELWDLEVYWLDTGGLPFLPVFESPAPH